MLKEHLEKLEKELDLPSLGTEKKEGVFSIKIEDAEFLCAELEPGIFIQASIHLVPSKKKEEIFTLLMSANFLGQGTGGSAIGIDEEEKFITLCYENYQDLDYRQFKELLEDFINFREYWDTEITRIEKEDSENPLRGGGR